MEVYSNNSLLELVSMKHCTMMFFSSKHLFVMGYEYWHIPFLFTNQLFGTDVFSHFLSSRMKRKRLVL